MNEKEMMAHIKMLSKIIQTQNEYTERLLRNFYGIERQLSVLHFKLAKLEGMKEKDI